mgnify:CR=1 FL=1
MYKILSNHIDQRFKFDIKNTGSLYVPIMHPILLTPKCMINYVNMYHNHATYVVMSTL